MTGARSMLTTMSMAHRLDLLPNPLAPSLRVFESLSSESQMRRPARLLEGALVERLAATESINPDWITVGGGIDDLLVTILRAFGTESNVVIFPPSDRSIGDHVARLGMEPVLVPRSIQFSTDLDRSGLPAFPANALTILQHPNDPTGTPTTVHDAVRLVRRSHLLVIDERHIGYGARSLLPIVREFDRVVVLRTFETWAGLSSLPVAYAIGPPDIIGAIRDSRMVRVATGPLAAAHASLDDVRGLQQAVVQIKDEKARLYRMLRKMNMVRPMPSWANFILVQVERGDPSFYPDELLRRDICVHVPDAPELEGYFRVSAVSHDATAALRAALIEIGQLV